MSRLGHCGACVHPASAEINHAILDGQTVAAIARFSFSTRDVWLVNCNSETGSPPAGRKIVTVTDSLGLESFTISQG
jgi:hypothetical protein